ncbi:ribosomal protein S6 [Neolentinus lepideus HHB14362 ss-1]|uniref:Ribosomal protein S6 n=1 Tax=Neolentinus lepideus HHB14362 ss-1 TaxID=1314782 RepID=A0A165RTW4_9AGAM|nr:ribosomal protein S6 [Neolentinus lepideus HHB14362 ss-1]
MPFYRMLCISVHYPEYKHIKGLVRQAALTIIENGGVVRKIDSWGTKVLPQKMHRHGQNHTVGDYWMMYFDTSPRVLREFNSIMRKDPSVIRWTTLKVGDKVEEIVSRPEKTLSDSYAQM